MALAILQLSDFNRDTVRFSIDTGTNRFYQLRIGRSTQQANGMAWVDDVVYTSPIQASNDAGNLFHGAREVALSARHLPDGDCYAQLFSFKDKDGRSTTFSDVLPLTGGFSLPAPSSTPSVQQRNPYDRKRVAPMSLTTDFARPRQLACSTAAERYARATSIEDVLGTVIKLATPLVSQLLGSAGAGPNAGASNTAPNGALANVLAVLLQTIMGNPGSAPVATAKSLSLDSAKLGNRFTTDQFSRPFIFGIDDALIGTLAGPILQLLPQLMNSANQRKIQMKQADDKLISDILSDVNRRMLLQQLANAQPAAGADAPDVAKLMEMLQNAAAAAPAASPAAGAAPAPAVSPAAPPAAKAVAKSLSMSGTDSGPQLSSRAVVDIIVGDLLPWHDTPHALFLKGRALKLNLKLTVGEPVPKAALPKAIIRLVFKNKSDGTIAFEKTFKQKNLAANSPFTLDFTAVELTPVPVDTVMDVVAELRWLTPATGVEYKALGSREMVFVNKTYFKSQASPLANELELTDMTRYRPFWNKVWESPVLDALSSSRDSKKYSWEVDLNAKYSVLLSSDHDANGLMDTKILKAAPEPDALSDITAGRMKAGIELSIAELNKLLPQWPGHTPLDSDHLQALRTAQFASSNVAESVSRIKFKGQAGERGMVWVVPVFNLVPCTFSTASKIDDSGQITGLQDEVLGFPLPVASRVLSLKSHAS